jgi:putative DNA primase/helicase
LPDANVTTLPVTKQEPPPTNGAAGAPPGGGEGAARSSTRPPSKREKKIDGGALTHLRLHFVLIQTTDTAYDESTGLIWKVNAMRLAFGHDEVKMWLADKLTRRAIYPHELVFAPGETVTEPRINLWHGFEMQPKAADCKPLLELLWHLHAESGATEAECAANMAWTLRWLALPLQRPGTKMRSALVFHGPQGAGKNLLFEAVASIYGRYALVVGQDQLEDKFNDWASQKLFLIGDEVVARAELWHQKNKLKAFITGETIQINAKMLPLRTEANHCNVVFLSNEPQPLALETGDRRYHVVYTPARREDGLYGRVGACLANGGAQAFYAYLLAMDLQDFGAHDIPPMTRAKADLIELGLRPQERFVGDWLDGNLDLPVRVCSSEQLYRAFVRWCQHTGERFPPPQTAFSKGVEKASKSRLELVPTKLDHPTAGGRQWLRVWVPGGCQPPAGVTRGQWARESVDGFEADLARFVRPVGMSEGSS